METNTFKQIIVFRERASRLRFQAITILIFIIALLASSITIFFFAADITKQDVSVNTMSVSSQDIHNKISSLENKKPKKPNFTPSQIAETEYKKLVETFIKSKKSFKNTLNSINSNISNKYIDRGVFNLASIINIEVLKIRENLQEDSNLIYFENEYITDNLINFKNYVSDSNVAKELQYNYDKIKEIAYSANKIWEESHKDYYILVENWMNEVSRIDEKINEQYFGLELILEKEKKEKFGIISSSQEKKEISIPFLIQTNITRFGPMIIILFFVSILINLYRYNTRLSAYYDARADALELITLNVNSTTFRSYVDTLSPDIHDIGKAPNLPTSDLINFAKSFVDKK